MPELVTTTLVDYEALALKLARESDCLGSLRTQAGVEPAYAPLFDSKKMTRNIEAALEEMWRGRRSRQGNCETITARDSAMGWLNIPRNGAPAAEGTFGKFGLESERPQRRNVEPDRIG